MNATGKRILIVEDQRLIAADIESTLKKLGYEVAASVATGEDAVRKASEVRPDLVLMDIRLRGIMDGIQAAEAIRARTDVPIVYLTAYADEETIVRARLTSPFGYLVKPFNERELRAAIEIAISKHETDRLLVEERAKRRAAEEFKLLVECVKDYAIYMLDSSGRVASWNAGAARIKGYTAEEIRGQHFSVFYRPEDVVAGEPDAALQAALRNGRSNVEGWRVRKDGSRFWANVVLTAIRSESGRLHGFGKITRDLTEQKRAEEQLRRWEHVFRNAAWGIALSSPEDRFIEVNHAFAALHGSVPEDWAGRPVEDMFADESKHLLPELVMQVHEKGHHSYESVHIRKDGSTFPVLTDVTAFKDESGGVLFRAASLQDITALKQTEQELRESVRSRDEFLQIASHELKTPLTPLQLQLDTFAVALERAGIQNERLWHKLETAMHQTARLARLVETLLDVSRITAGRVELEIEPLDLAEIVRDVVERFRPEARKAGSELTVHADETISGHWDRLRLEQIVCNLLINAIKYGRAKPIEVEARVSDAAVRLSIKDHGIGIEKEALARIFGRFERAVSLRHYGGLGLGLFIARQFAEAHGGSIVAQSQPQVGSTFTVVLPLDATAPSGAGSERQGTTP